MMWKAIGSSLAGTSHDVSGKPCEDALQYRVMVAPNGKETLICVASDGAGSALYGGWAADYTTRTMLERLAGIVTVGKLITDAGVYEIVEDIYNELLAEATAKEVELNEFSCTLLGCVISEGSAVFFQIGDGALVRSSGAYYTHVWWPENGEYQNSTTFLVDDAGLGNLKILMLDERVDEVAIFTDGLQMLALNMETTTVHQPFFTDLFRYLRMADTDEKINILNSKLTAYLGSSQINDRTDDDKTLFLATRIKLVLK